MRSGASSHVRVFTGRMEVPLQTETSDGVWSHFVLVFGSTVEAIAIFNSQHASSRSRLWKESWGMVWPFGRLLHAEVIPFPLSSH